MKSGSARDDAALVVEAKKPIAKDLGQDGSAVVTSPDKNNVQA